MQSTMLLLALTIVTPGWGHPIAIAQQSMERPIHEARYRPNQQSTTPAGSPNPYAGRSPTELANTMVTFAALGIELSDGTCAGVLGPSSLRISDTLEMAIDYVPRESKTDVRRRAFELETNPTEWKVLVETNRRVIATRVASGEDRIAACAIVGAEYVQQEVQAFEELSKYPHQPGR